MTDGGAGSALFLLGAYHGVNPGMGWLFAVALGMQERSSGAVGRALLPISVGHGLAIGAVVAFAALVRSVIPLTVLKIAVAIVLLSFGLYHLIRQRHPAWGGMRVGFRDLTFWSFLMASAHGAGFMVLPILFGLAPDSAHAGHGTMGIVGGLWTGVWAVVVHTSGYLLVTGLVAWIVYKKLGLVLLRKAWLNLDFVWAIALVGTAIFTLFI